MTIKHKAVYTTSYNNKKCDHKVYDYSDGIDLADNLNNCFVVNVPCYNIEDVTQAIEGSKSRWFSHLTQMELHTHIYTITTKNSKGKTFWYLLATPEVDEYVKKHATFGIIKGNTSKMPKKHFKVVRVYQRGVYRDQSKQIDCSIQNKHLSKYLTDQVKEVA